MQEVKIILQLNYLMINGKLGLAHFHLPRNSPNKINNNRSNFEYYAQNNRTD
jgi:hypothetical protein